MAISFFINIILIFVTSQHKCLLFLVIVSDVDMLIVSKFVTTDTELHDLGAYLGVSDNTIRSRRRNIPRDINPATYEVLRMWKYDKLTQGYTPHQLKENLKYALRKASIPLETDII